jgi:hypothetical protein
MEQLMNAAGALVSWLGIAAMAVGGLAIARVVEMPVDLGRNGWLVVIFAGAVVGTGARVFRSAG